MSKMQYWPFFIHQVRMGSRKRVLAAIASVLIMTGNVRSQGLDSSAIAEVVVKPMLDSGDMKVIDDFVKQATSVLITARDPSFAIRARTELVRYKSSSESSAQRQYGTQFSESATKHIADALEQAAELSVGNRRLLAMLNLLVLVDNLGDAQLADIAIGMLKNEYGVVRYWAVHCLTNSAVTEQLNEPANLDLARRVVGELSSAIGNSSPQTLADFGAFLSIPESADLVTEIADVRMKEYEEGSVEYERVDADVLKALCAKITSAKQENKAAPARRFAQLYSYAIQRYAKGTSQGWLINARKQQLMSVLAETEGKCLHTLLGARQTNIRRALEQGDVEALMAAHDGLLGDETTAGRLAEKLGFHYGEDPGGQGRTAPVALPDAPAAEPPK